MDTTMDTLSQTINWLERLSRIARDSDKALADTMAIDTWTDVNVLINSQHSVKALIKELNVMVSMMTTRKIELANMLKDILQ